MNTSAKSQGLGKLGTVASTTAELLRAPVHAGGGATFARTWARFPMEYAARRRLGEVPQLSVPAFLDEIGSTSLSFPSTVDRHDWNLGAVEQAILAEVAATDSVTTIFEIGTFDGATTHRLATASGTDAQVHTLDLAPAAFDQSQNPDSFGGADVGRMFRDTPEASRITQHLGDSLTFDYSPWSQSIDLVFVDGAHDYEHGLADSRHALEMVKPGGYVFWDDIAPYWYGLIDGILEATEGRDLRLISRTSFATLRG